MLQKEGISDVGILSAEKQPGCEFFYLCLKLHLGIGLIQPAVEVRSQKERPLLLQRQAVPPALFLLLDFDVYLTLC